MKQLTSILCFKVEIGVETALGVMVRRLRMRIAVGSEGENWDELIVFEVGFFDAAIAVSQLSVAMSFILFESADVDLAAGPLQLSSSLPFSIHELSCVAHSIWIGLYSKTVL